MEKYLVFIILVVLVYYLFNCWVENKVNNILKTKEGFAGTTGSTNDADVASSINTLAQIAKDLQAGGLTVPGALNIKAGINTDGDINAKSAINATGDINTKGVINATGDINAGGNINIKKNIFLGDGKQDWGSVVSIRGGINDNGYLEFKNKEDVRQCYLMGKPDGAMFSQNLRVSGDLIVKDRNILAELDDIKKRAIFDTDKVSAIMAPRRPDGNTEDNKHLCYDFGSQGRKNCMDRWTTIILRKRTIGANFHPTNDIWLPIL